jgi:hypothetical protein
VIPAALALFAAPVMHLPNVSAWPLDQRIAYLAVSEARMARRLEDAVYEDPTMRAEIKRVGLTRGCDALASASKESIALFAGVLAPHFESAIRLNIPAQRINDARFLSFSAMPFASYRHRVVEQAERSGSADIARARADLRERFLQRTRPIETTRNDADNVVMPRPDTGAALGIAGPWNLDKPSQLAMACIEHTIRPEARPEIIVGEAR